MDRERDVVDGDRCILSGGQKGKWGRLEDRGWGDNQEKRDDEKEDQQTPDGFGCMG
jgi:hypothetical protein